MDPDLLPAATSDPERELLSRLGEEAVLDAIADHLEPDEQRAIWLRCFEMLSVPAESEILGCEGVSGACAVLQRARRKLRAALAEPDEGATEP